MITPFAHFNRFRPAAWVPSNRRRTLRRTIQRTFAAWMRRYPHWVNSGFDEYFLLHDALPLLDAMLYEGQALTPIHLAQQWVAAYGIPPRCRDQAVAECLPVVADFLHQLQREQSIPAM